MVVIFILNFLFGPEILQRIERRQERIENQLAEIPAQGLKLLLQSVLNPWDMMSSERTRDINEAVAVAARTFYGIRATSYCMILGTGCPGKAAHIWPFARSIYLPLVDLTPEVCLRLLLFIS